MSDLKIRKYIWFERFILKKYDYTGRILIQRRDYQMFLANGIYWNQQHETIVGTPTDYSWGSPLVGIFCWCYCAFIEDFSEFCTKYTILDEKDFTGDSNG